MVPVTFSFDRDEDIFQQKFKIFVHFFNKLESKLKEKSNKSLTLRVFIMFSFVLVKLEWLRTF